jgi:hypothetical protein
MPHDQQTVDKLLKHEVCTKLSEWTTHWTDGRSTIKCGINSEIVHRLCEDPDMYKAMGSTHNTILVGCQWNPTEDSIYLPTDTVYKVGPHVGDQHAR